LAQLLALRITGHFGVNFVSHFLHRISHQFVVRGAGESGAWELETRRSPLDSQFWRYSRLTCRIPH